MAKQKSKGIHPSVKRSARTRELETAKLAVIGGSGLYQMEGLTDVREIKVTTPFGQPSDHLILGTLHGKRVAFLPRHGRGHVILPSELNFRANIYALKKIGVERIFSVSAVGSLKEELKPLDFVIPDQFFDRTRHRIDTFFGGGMVVHIGFSDPICSQIAEIAQAACREAGVTVHRGGTYVNMEGPQFSTKAESSVYRQWGMDIIGMTNLQEAKLAREAEICYTTIAMVTDYDCWHPGHDAVTVETVIAYLTQNIAQAQKVIAHCIRAVPEERTCKCGSALAHAIQTDRSKITSAVKKKYALLVGKYFS